jgi:hypothetical protein
MKERTMFRLAMWDNGYWPVLNDCKAAVLTNWQKQRPSRDEVLSWDRSAYPSTGMKIDGDLAVIDTDVEDAGLVAKVADALNERFPELFARGLVRHASGPKEAWIARVDKPVQYFDSRKWCCGGDPGDPAVVTHHVECFGSLATRQLGIDGPHSRDQYGRVIRTYQFAGGVSPATTPRTSLPVLPKAAYATACDLFDKIAEAAGLTAIKQVKSDGGAGSVYDLTNDMVFESGSCSYTLDELDDARVAAEHEGRDLRLTSSFLGHGTNPTKCIVGYSWRSRCVFIHDFKTGLTHMPSNRAPPTVFKFLEQIGKGAGQ